MTDNKAFPWGAYRDPSNFADSLRAAERHVSDTCNGCVSDMGTLWGQHVCDKGKKRDEDGYCPLMDKGAS